MRVQQPTVVIDRHSVVAALLLQSQIDRSLPVLGGADDLLEHVAGVVLAVHRNQGGAGACVSIERRTIPPHVVGLAATGKAISPLDRVLVFVGVLDWRKLLT